MQRRETVMTGDRYKLVRYDMDDNDELYPANGRVPRDMAEDLCMDPDEWVPYVMPWTNVGGSRFWLNVRESDLYGIFKL